MSSFFFGLGSDLNREIKMIKLETRGNQDESRELIDGNQNHPSRGRKFFITPNWFTRWAFGRIVSWEDCLGICE